MKNKRIGAVIAGLLCLAASAHADSSGIGFGPGQSMSVQDALSAAKASKAPDSARMILTSHHLRPPAPPSDGEEGLEAAARLCFGLYYDSDKRQCMDIVNGASYFPAAAVAVCASVYYDSGKIACARAIANKRILAVEASNCGDQYYDSNKIACFSRITRRPGWPRHESDGLEAAASLCFGLYYDSAKEQCMGIVGGASYFSAAAVAVCASVYYDSGKIACAGAIANKRILAVEASNCGDQYYDSNKIACFSRITRRPLGENGPDQRE